MVSNLRKIVYFSHYKKLFMMYFIPDRETLMIQIQNHYSKVSQAAQSQKLMIGFHFSNFTLQYYSTETLQFWSDE